MLLLCPEILKIPWKRGSWQSWTSFVFVFVWGWQYIQNAFEDDFKAAFVAVFCCAHQPGVIGLNCQSHGIVTLGIDDAFCLRFQKKFWALLRYQSLASRCRLPAWNCQINGYRTVYLDFHFWRETWCWRRLHRYRSAVYWYRRWCFLADKSDKSANIR